MLSPGLSLVLSVNCAGGLFTSWRWIDRSMDALTRYTKYATYYTLYCIQFGYVEQDAFRR